MKYIFAVLSCLCIATGSLDGQSVSFSHEEIMQEIQELRENEYRLRKGLSFAVENFSNWLDDARALQQTSSFIEYLKKSYLFSIHIPLIREFSREFAGGMVMITPERAPKIYALVESIADKLALKMPLLYFRKDECCKNKPFFNPLIIGFLQSTSALCLGEKLLQTTSMDELKFVIAHELSHVKNRHKIKGLGVGIGACVAIFTIAFWRDEPAILPLGIGILPFAMPAYWRHNEYEADRLAAQTVGASGGIVLMKQFKEFEPHVEEDFASLYSDMSNSPFILSLGSRFQIAIAKKIAQLKQWWFFKSLFRSHPTADQRTNALKNL